MCVDDALSHVDGAVDKYRDINSTVVSVLLISRNEVLYRIEVIN